MTSSCTHDHPPYDVIAVCDDESDQPFAYTVGVWRAYGGPELFAWGIPDSGVDSGESWQLSSLDLHTGLTGAVDRMRGAGLALGDTWSTPLDHGRSVIVTTVVEADEVPSYDVEPGVPVWRLHQQLLRPPAGRFTPLDDAPQVALVERMHRWHSAFGLDLDVAGLREDDCYGPGSAGVRLVLDLLAGLGVDDLWGVAVLEAASRHGSNSAVTELQAVARTAGRREWVDAAGVQVDWLVEQRLRLLPAQDRCRVGHHLNEAFQAAATTWVLADLVDVELFRRATATVRSFAGLELCLEHDAPAPVCALAEIDVLLSRLARGWRPGPFDDDLTSTRALWMLAWSGRGAALADHLAGASLPADLSPDVLRPLLCAAVAQDLDPELAALLR